MTYQFDRYCFYLKTTAGGNAVLDALPVDEAPAPLRALGAGLTEDVPARHEAGGPLPSVAD